MPLRRKPAAAARGPRGHRPGPLRRMNDSRRAVWAWIFERWCSSSADLYSSLPYSLGRVAVRLVSSSGPPLSRICRLGSTNQEDTVPITRTGCCPGPHNLKAADAPHYSGRAHSEAPRRVRPGASITLPASASDQTSESWPGSSGPVQAVQVSAALDHYARAGVLAQDSSFPVQPEAQGSKACCWIKQS